MAKKKTKSFLPKRIAGVKVPKAVRKGRLGELLASKRGQALIAEAIMAAGAVGAAKKAKDDPNIRHYVTDAARPGEIGAAGGALAYALGEAARSFADALRRGPDEREAGGEMAWTPDYGAPEPRTDAKKKPTREASPL
jgi:hypothetical protein